MSFQVLLSSQFEQELAPNISINTRDLDSWMILFRLYPPQTSKPSFIIILLAEVLVYKMQQKKVKEKSNRKFHVCTCRMPLPHAPPEFPWVTQSAMSFKCQIGGQACGLSVSFLIVHSLEIVHFYFLILNITL